MFNHTFTRWFSSLCISSLWLLYRSLWEAWRAALEVTIGIMFFTELYQVSDPQRWNLNSLPFSFHAHTLFLHSPSCYDSIVSPLNASSLALPQERWVFSLRSAYGGCNLLLFWLSVIVLRGPCPQTSFSSVVLNSKTHLCLFAFFFNLQRHPLSCKVFGL